VRVGRAASGLARGATRMYPIPRGWFGQQVPMIYFLHTRAPGFRARTWLSVRGNGAVGPQAMSEIAAAHRWRSHNMADLSALELEVAQTIVEALNLEDTRAEDIDPEEALFRDGLGLDSIDALEIALAISMKYGFQIRSDDNDNARIFASLRSLSQHVGENRVK